MSKAGFRADLDRCLPAAGDNVWFVGLNPAVRDPSCTRSDNSPLIKTDRSPHHCLALPADATALALDLKCAAVRPKTFGGQVIRA